MLWHHFRRKPKKQHKHSHTLNCAPVPSNGMDYKKKFKWESPGIRMWLTYQKKRMNRLLLFSWKSPTFLGLCLARCIESSKRVIAIAHTHAHAWKQKQPQQQRKKVKTGAWRWCKTTDKKWHIRFIKRMRW